MENKEHAYEWIDDLYDLYVLPSISALARDLSIGVDTLIAVHARKEPISHALAKRLMYLWALKLGKVYYPAPKPVFEIPEIRAERLQRAHEQIDDLYKLYSSISKLASYLEIDVDTFSRLHAKKEPISAAFAKKLMYLWALKLGKVYFPAPKPVFEIPEISAERLQRAHEQIDDLYNLTFRVS